MKNLKHIGQKGQGYFCILKLYEDENTGEQFAMKELKKEHYQNDEYRYRLNREIQLLKDLQGCENIVKLVDFGHNTAKEKLWYLMPYANSNLHDYIKQNNTKLTIEERFSIIEQIMEAVKYAHKKGILHRDISPTNVLVFLSNNHLYIKVCDFGLGKDLESISHYTRSSATGYGQILYISPEQKDKLKDATEKSDIYSLGKLIYFIYTGKDPIDIKPTELSSLIIKATEESQEDRFGNIDELIKHYSSLKKLILNEDIPEEYITLKVILDSNKEIDWNHFHRLAIKGDYYDHVYYDYIDPVIDFLSKDNNLSKYYVATGNSIVEFVKTFDARLKECLGTTRWPFVAMNDFGYFLADLYRITPKNEIKIICIKALWLLAYEADQWKVQTTLENILYAKDIPNVVLTQLAEYIIQTENKYDLQHFSSLNFPVKIKSAVIQSTELANNKET